MFWIRSMYSQNRTQTSVLETVYATFFLFRQNQRAQTVEELWFDHSLVNLIFCCFFNLAYSQWLSWQRFTLQSLGPCTPCPAVNARAAVHLKSTSLPHFGELAQVSRCSRKAEFDVQVFKKSWIRCFTWVTKDEAQSMQGQGWRRTCHASCAPLPSSVATLPRWVTSSPGGVTTKVHKDQVHDLLDLHGFLVASVA